jgi:methylglyoxal synthase
MSENINMLPESSFEESRPEALILEKTTEQRKRIALVAHDNKKQDLLEWACYNRELLVQHDLYATGTTGHLLSEQLKTPVTCLQSGPLGGDQQIGSRIAEGKIDLLIFFWDPLEPQPHDTDVKALLRIAVVWNIPVACDRATADFVISSPLMTGEYKRLLPDYTRHVERFKSRQNKQAQRSEALG